MTFRSTRTSVDAIRSAIFSASRGCPPKAPTCSVVVVPMRTPCWAAGAIVVSADAVTRSVLRELGPGGWFGELALLHDVPRTATVRTLEDVDVVVLDRDTFLSAVTGAPRSVAAAHSEASARYADLRDDPETES